MYAQTKKQRNGLPYMQTFINLSNRQLKMIYLAFISYFLLEK